MYCTFMVRRASHTTGGLEDGAVEAAFFTPFQLETAATVAAGAEYFVQIATLDTR
jgi:hypothetical protein